jgi:hypothetical protein
LNLSGTAFECHTKNILPGTSTRHDGYVLVSVFASRASAAPSEASFANRYKHFQGLAIVRVRKTEQSRYFDAKNRWKANRREGDGLLDPRANPIDICKSSSMLENYR